MEMLLKLSREEIQKKIPYAIVCETMSSSVWGTGRRKRLMKERFTEEEISKFDSMHNQARSWFLKKGVPNELVISISDIGLWERLAAFCCEL